MENWVGIHKNENHRTIGNATIVPKALVEPKFAHTIVFVPKKNPQYTFNLITFNAISLWLCMHLCKIGAIGRDFRWSIIICSCILFPSIIFFFNFIFLCSYFRKNKRTALLDYVFLGGKIRSEHIDIVCIKHATNRFDILVSTEMEIITLWLQFLWHSFDKAYTNDHTHTHIQTFTPNTQTAIKITVQAAQKSLNIYKIVISRIKLAFLCVAWHQFWTFDTNGSMYNVHHLWNTWTEIRTPNNYWVHAFNYRIDETVEILDTTAKSIFIRCCSVSCKLYVLFCFRRTFCDFSFTYTHPHTHIHLLFGSQHDSVPCVSSNSYNIQTHMYMRSLLK